MSSPTLRSILEACDRLDCLSLFDEHEIATEQLPGLTGDDLKEIGIEKLGHRKAILAAIAEAFARPPAEGQETGNEPVLSALAATTPAAVAPSSDAASTEAAAQAADAPPDRPKIFLSYGRRDASELAQRLCRDLEAVGFEVWMDVEKLVPGSRWQEEIEEALREAQVVVSLLSPHAVRRGSDSDPTDSFCLDELALARAGRPPTPVVPAMVAACEPPLIIYRLDYVDLLASQQSEDEYRRGFDRLVSGIREALAGKVRYRFWDDRLRPLDFSDYLARKRGGFVGREWLFDEIDLWRYQSAERALLVTGDPGAGKSSIVAQLAHTNPGGQVIAYYFCQSNERETLSPARFVQSVAAMIASRLPAYAEQFEVPAVREALDEQRCERDPGGSFLAGILQPLQKLPDPGEGVRYLLVDALDEALLHGGDTNILDVLAERIERFPPWLRLVATTRNEPSVLQRLSGLRPKRLDAADPRNLADLGAWIRHRLLEPTLAEQLVESRAIADRVVAALLEKSTGNFLYAVNALNGIERGFYSFAQLAALPPGLDGLYLDFFRRLFGREGTAEGEAAYARARPLLQVLTAAIEPLSRAELAAASGLDAEEELPRLLRQLAQLHVRRVRPNGEETIAFYHKSIADWLVSNPDGNAFAISPAKGRALLAGFCRAALDTSRAEPCWYVRRHAVAHLLEAADWDGATAALADLEFIEARAIAQELPAMLVDYAAAGRLLPEARQKCAEKETRRKVSKDYGMAMVDYAAAWTRIRDGSDEPEPVLPKPPPSVRPWTSEEIRRERARLTEMPDRADRTEAFRRFVATHIAPLSEHADRDGFVANVAHNSAPGGPVHESGARLLVEGRQVKLVRNFHPDEVYNPLEACVGILEGHTDRVTAVSVTPDGQRAISGGWDTTVRVWNVDSGECLRVLVGHSHRVRAVATSAEGRFAISASDDKTIRVWDISSGECIRIFEKTSPWQDSIPFARYAGSGSDDTYLLVRDLNSRDCLRILREQLRVWDLQSGRLHILRSQSPITDRITVTPDGQIAIAYDLDENLIVWKSGKSFRIIHKIGTYKGSKSSLALTADGSIAVSGGGDGNLRVWNLESGETTIALGSHTAQVESLSLISSKKMAVSVGGLALRIWDIDSGNCINVIEGSLQITCDGRFAFSSGHEFSLLLYDLESGESLAPLVGHTDRVIAACVTPNRRMAVSGSADKTLRIWDLKSRECIRVIKLCVERTDEISISPDGRIAVLSGSFYDVDSGACLGFPEHYDWVTTACLTPDDRVAVSASFDKTLRVWDLRSGNSICTLVGHENVVGSLSISPDGRLAVSGSFDKTMRVWDLRTGKCLRILNGYTYLIASNAELPNIYITPDGRLVVSSGRIWNLDTGESLAVFFLRGLASFEVDWSRRRLVAGFSDGRVEFYQIENLSLGPFITTAQRELASEDLPAGPVTAGPVTARPVCCGEVIEIPPVLAERIEHWHLAGHDRGDRAYTDPALLLDCPSCGTPLRMNPFFVDVRPWSVD